MEAFLSTPAVAMPPAALAPANTNMPAAPAPAAGKPPPAPPAAAAPSPSAEEVAARTAWAAIAKPVTEETFVAWYVAAHPHKKRAAPKPASGAAPAAKKQATLGGGVAVTATAMPKGKRSALLKAVAATLKAAIKVRSTYGS